MVITGYTVSAGTVDEPELLRLTSPYSGPGFEPLLWDIADRLKAELESRHPALTFHNSVTRHEREDVQLTHP
ncbi:hypothetical protein [Streptomyces sp. SudanB91_2054]|uniref:hypothetical protein n=1 Tax=Streptomyces sp. SudanB91_2054 TaxID=3035278 RepID=UPI0036D8FBD4